MTFEQLGVSEEIRRAIDELGFVEPMPVQEQVIPQLLAEGTDLVALAQTGTGKTAAYGLPLLQKISLNEGIEHTKYEAVQVQALVLSPTRELCLQIADDLRSYSKYIDHLHVLAVYGGANIETQIRQLKRGVQVVVATPGRLVDLMNRGVARLDHVQTVVLDEADEMLSMGFSESIDTILAAVPENRNTLLFSATMSREIERISKNYLHEAKEIVVGSRNEGAEHVDHYYYLVRAHDKYNALKRIADYYPEIYAIIFCRTRMETQEIADRLIADGYNAEALHGELSQAQRDLTMAKFRNHTVQLLVATDVAARGLDVDNLTHVVNYGLPDEIESYTHRSGRTGRAGRTGISISIIHIKEKHKVQAIEKQIGKKFVASTLPTSQEICQKQLMKVIDDIEKVEVDEEMIAPFMPDINRKYELMEKDDIIKKMVSMQFNKFLNYYRSAPEILQPGINEAPERGNRSKKNNKSGVRGDKFDGTPEQGYTRMFINLGKMDGLTPRSFMGFLNRVSHHQQFTIGRIDLMKTYSFFEVRNEHAEALLRALNRAEYDGRPVSVERADAKQTAQPKRKQQKAARPAKRTSALAKDKQRPEWAQFFEGQVSDQPFYEMFQKNKKGKKKKQ